ncbi:hypothetical protein AB0E74_10825 [Streptomyces sp. NPDC030392]|uniref:hypothetical protein n=1 Tax=Streptomyces sp. NPDC030392 TaxID=3155468 RepID=UPI0033CB49AB
MTRPDELRLEAARKRQELVETIDQLMAKTDLRARAARMDRRPLVAASAGGVALAALGAVLTNRARARTRMPAAAGAGAGVRQGAMSASAVGVRRGRAAARPGGVAATRTRPGAGGRRRAGGGFPGSVFGHGKTGRGGWSRRGGGKTALGRLRSGGGLGRLRFGGGR